jgi:hypothetical protein
MEAGSSGTNPTLSDFHTSGITTLVAYLSKRTFAAKSDKKIARPREEEWTCVARVRLNDTGSNPELDRYGKHLPTVGGLEEQFPTVWRPGRDIAPAGRDLVPISTF